jgi:hypothetical protein
MSDETDLIRIQEKTILILKEFRDEFKPIIEERDLLLAFVREVRNSGCSLTGNTCIACDALTLLRVLEKENEFS